MNISLRQLEFLLAAAEHLNFTRAAAACHVTQPSLGEQLQKLEASLGVTLLERDRRSVRLTPAGEALVDQARTVLTAVRSLKETASRYKQPLVGPLRLGIIPTVAPYLLPCILPKIHARFPDLKLFLCEDHTERLVARLERGDLDLLLLALEARLGDTDTEPLFEDPFYFAAAHEHPLSAKQTIREPDLAEAHVFLLDDGHCLRDQVLSLCERIGATDLDDFRAGSLGTLVQMVATGVGVTLIPAMARRVEADACGERGLAIRTFEEPKPYRTIGLAWRRGSARVDEFRLFGAQVLEAHKAHQK